VRESGEFKVQRSLIVHIGRRLSPSGKKRAKGATRRVMCKWGRLYGYIYNLISAFAIKNKMDGVVWTPPVVIDDRQGLHGAKQGR